MLRDASEWISAALARPVLTSLQRCCRKNLNLPFAGPRKPAHGIKENGQRAQHVRRKASSQGSRNDLRIRRGISARCVRERVSLGSRQEMPFEDNRTDRCFTSRCAWSNQPYFMFILLLMVSCSGYSSGVAAHCEKGVKYFDKNSATCVPCSECKRPLYAIIPCYEFMDTVCDNPAEFLSERSGVVGSSNTGNAGGNHPNPSTDGNLTPNGTRPSNGRVSSEPGRRGRRKKNGKKKKRRKNGRKRKNKNGTEFDDRLSIANSNSNTNSMHDDYNSGARGPVFGNYLDYDASFYEYPDYLEYWDALRAEYEQNGHSPNSFSNPRNNPDSDTIYPQEISDERSVTPKNIGDKGSAQNTATVGLNEINSSDVNEPIKGNVNSTIKSNATSNSDNQNLDKMDANNDSFPQNEVSTVPRPRFEVGKLWRNGWTTAVVLALVIVVGLMAVALIIVLGMHVFIYSKNRIDRMKDKNDYQDNGGGFSSAVLLHQSPPSPILATSDAHHLQHKLKDSDEKENSDVLIGGGSLPVARPKARKLGFTLGRGSKEKIFHVARTYKPAPCRSKFDLSQDLAPMHDRLVTLAPNPALLQNSAFIECSGTTYCSGEWLDHNCIPPGYEAGSKETTFTSLSSANNSPPLSPLSDGPAPQSFAPKPPSRLTKSQEEKILRSSNASSHSTPIVDCVLSSNVVTFDDGSTLSTTTNYTTNPRPSTGRALTNAPAYSQTLPTTYVRTSPRTLSSDHQQNTGSPPSSSASAHGGADVSPSFPAILESKGSPIPYTMDRLLEQRRRLGCASSVDTNIYVEMWRGSSAAPSNNPSAVPSPALQHRTTTSTTSVPSSSSSTHRAGEEGVGDSFAALERNLATLSRGIESLHASTRGSSPSGTSGGSPSLRRGGGGGGGSSNNSSICSSRLAHRLTAHLNSVAAANTLQGSPKLTLRHFK